MRYACYDTAYRDEGIESSVNRIRLPSFVVYFINLQFTSCPFLYVAWAT